MKKIASFIIIVIISSVGLYRIVAQDLTPQPSSTISTTANNAPLETNTITDKSDHIASTSSQPVKISAPQETEKAENTALSKEIFLDGESFTNAFYIEPNVISKKMLIKLLTTDDIHQVISKISAIPPSQASTDREYQLTQGLKAFKQTNFYAESYACSGKVCAISFNYDQLNDDEVNQFGHFSKNHPFTTTSENEFGEKQFIGVYIATDDPSKLTMR
ncbi:hypothetical protein [Shewanella waksmanii]|uniref:hypothetical protein n=1 Tax=Shewanella waksmanii TaxID=213783 RepID=UPI0037357B1B